MPSFLIGLSGEKGSTLHISFLGITCSPLVSSDLVLGEDTVFLQSPLVNCYIHFML